MSASLPATVVHDLIFVIAFPQSLHTEQSIRLLIAMVEDSLTRDFGTPETHALVCSSTASFKLTMHNAQLTRTLRQIASDRKDSTGADVMRQDHVLGL